MRRVLFAIFLLLSACSLPDAGGSPTAPTIPAGPTSPPKIIGLDTSVFIYFHENNERYGELARITISGIEKENGRV
jgi:hypothetical protein